MDLSSDPQHPENLGVAAHACNANARVKTGGSWEFTGQPDSQKQQTPDSVRDPVSRYKMQKGPGNTP